MENKNKIECFVLKWILFYFKLLHCHISMLILADVILRDIFRSRFDCSQFRRAVVTISPLNKT